jgi:hypothetical protein
MAIGNGCHPGAAEYGGRFGSLGPKLQNFSKFQNQKSKISKTKFYVYHYTFL